MPLAPAVTSLRDLLPVFATSAEPLGATGVLVTNDLLQDTANLDPVSIPSSKRRTF